MFRYSNKLHNQIIPTSNTTHTVSAKANLSLLFAFFRIVSSAYYSVHQIVKLALLHSCSSLSNSHKKSHVAHYSYVYRWLKEIIINSELNYSSHSYALFSPITNYTERVSTFLTYGDDGLCAPLPILPTYLSIVRRNIMVKIAQSIPLTWPVRFELLLSNRYTNCKLRKFYNKIDEKTNFFSFRFLIEGKKG